MPMLETTTVDSTRIGKTAWSVLRHVRPDWSVDELLLHPTIAIDVCRRTNLTLGLRRTHDEILRALLNCRKRGQLKAA